MENDTIEIKLIKMVVPLTDNNWNMSPYELLWSLSDDIDYF